MTNNNFFKLVFASSNQNKINEIKQLLPPDIELLSLHDINCNVEIPETAETIEGNAILKADYVTRNYGLDCFADDSGLEVAALNGAPGVHSARYAGAHKNNDDNISKLLSELKSDHVRTARFKTVIALNYRDEQHLFTGLVFGKITEQRSGNQGFGYDSVFIPDGHSRTFAQMSASEKAAISHRAAAVQQLIKFLKK